MVVRLVMARAAGVREGMAGMTAAVAATAREEWVRSDWDFSQQNTCLAKPGMLGLKHQISQGGDSVTQC